MHIYYRTTGFPISHGDVHIDTGRAGHKTEVAVAVQLEMCHNPHILCRSSSFFEKYPRTWGLQLMTATEDTYTFVITLLSG